MFRDTKLGCGFLFVGTPVAYAIGRFIGTWPAAIGAFISGIIGICFLVSAYRHKENISAQEQLAQFELKQRQSENQISAYGEALCIFANSMKKEKGTQNLIISEDQLRSVLMLLNPEGVLMLHTILGNLQAKGKAKKTGSPGWWYID